MVKSMTGFGKAEIANEDLKLQVEIKSVNNRYLDFNIRSPRKFNGLEAKIRNLLSSQIARGKVDVFIVYKEYSAEAGAVRLNRTLAGEYIDRLREISNFDGVSDNIKPKDIALFPDVITVEEEQVDEEELWKLLEGLLKDALREFMDARVKEGEFLKANIIEKLDVLKREVSLIEEHEPEIMEAYKAKLRSKLDEVLQDTQIDESRVVSEMVIYSDKICTDEETVRLKSHVEKMRDLLESDESIGRNLDFLAQEMNREANTILSKSGDLITSDVALSLKSGIEKIREQIQNIE